MMISHEQARAAAIHLHYTGETPRERVRPDVSDEVLAAALAAAQNAPEENPGRLADMQRYRDGACADSRAVASMMISRIISDSLR
jgi:hypothetical protein